MTSLRSVLLAAAGLVAAGLVAAVALVPSASANEIFDEILRGREIAPVPLKIPRNVDPFSAYLGAYVVEAVATCNSCHSNNEYAAGHNPFLGQPKQVNATCYLNGGQSFGNGIVSLNITPDKTGKPAGLDFGTFLKVMRTGYNPQDPGTLLQVMPWDGFQNMTDTDLKAIYDYLSSIPSLPTGGTSPC
jgi:cytochrome c1